MSQLEVKRTKTEKKPKETKIKCQDDIDLMFEYSKMVFDNKHEAFKKVCTENGNIRGTYYTDGVIKLSMETWHDEILNIYTKLSYYKLSRSEIREVSQYIRNKINEMMHFVNDKPISDDPPNPSIEKYKATLFTQIKTAILEGNKLLEDKYRTDRKDAFRIYFPVLLGILGSLVAAVIGAILF